MKSKDKMKPIYQYNSIFNSSNQRLIEYPCITVVDELNKICNFNSYPGYTFAYAQMTTVISQLHIYYINNRHDFINS